MTRPSGLDQASRRDPPLNSSRHRDVLLGFAALAMLIVTAAGGELLTAGLNDPAALSAAAARLDRLPETIGAWTSTPGEVSEREQRLAQITRYVRREYKHQETGYSVIATVLCGPAGPMSVHPPTACFEGVGYRLSSGPAVVTLPFADSAASLNKAMFRPPQAVANEIVRVFWGWSSDGLWSAPANPRIAFRGQPALFKLYVVDQGLESATDLEQAEAFLSDALPVLREALRP